MYIKYKNTKDKYYSLKTSCSLKWESNMYQLRRALKMIAIV